MRLELDEAELLLTRALELAGESGSVRARMSATLVYGWFLRLKGELDAAETVLEEVRATAAELGIEPMVAGALAQARLDRAAQGRPQARGEDVPRGRSRSRALAATAGCSRTTRPRSPTTLADLGKVDEAERLALEAVATPCREDTMCQIFATTALASVRAAQERDDEAEELFRLGDRGRAGGRTTSCTRSTHSSDSSAFSASAVVTGTPRVPTRRGSPSSPPPPRARPRSPDSSARPATRR